MQSPQKTEDVSTAHRKWKSYFYHLSICTIRIILERQKDQEICFLAKHFTFHFLPHEDNSHFEGYCETHYYY
jgi:hypothetical protein